MADNFYKKIDESVIGESLNITTLNSSPRHVNWKKISFSVVFLFFFPIKRDNNNNKNQSLRVGKLR